MPTPRAKEMIRQYVAQAKFAHINARSFAEIGQQHLAVAWSRHAKNCMAHARAVKHSA